MKGKKAKTKKFTVRTKILFIMNGIFILLLMLCYINPYINTATFPYLAPFALAYPFLLLINICFILYWLIRGRLTFLFSAFAILLGISYLFKHFQFHGNSTGDLLNKPALKVMTYNVHLFGFYDWKHNMDTRSKIMAMLEKSDADVYCFQEFFENDKDFPMVDTLKSLLKTPYVYTDYFLTINKINHYGLAIFSRFPILDSGRIMLKPGHSNYSIYNDILWNNDTIRVINNHLESIRFSQADYSFYEELTRNPSDQKDVKTGSINIMKKLDKAYRKRALQADLVRSKIDDSPYPVIVCGDFNDTPLSYVYHKISEGLRDAFVQAGFGLGKTYSGVFPSFRIDYVLFSPKFKAVEYRTIRKNYSDHYPVTARLVISEIQSSK